MQIRSLGQEDPLEKEMETRSSILAWEIPWTEEPDGLQSIGLRRVRRDQTTTTIPLFRPFNQQTEAEGTLDMTTLILTLSSISWVEQCRGDWQSRGTSWPQVHTV